MAGPNPERLVRVVRKFPTPPEGDQFTEADELLDGAYSSIADAWYPELQRLASAYAEGECLREEVLAHVEAVPSFRLTDGAAPLTARRDALVTAAGALEEIAAVSEWYRDVRDLLTDDPAELTLFERVLHDFGYVVAHVLFLGASSPPEVVRRLRLAYQLVGVDIDETASRPGGERTTFTCPYRNLDAGRRGTRWVCHEKLDRVDDGYVTYLAERGIDYQRPRGCRDSCQCYSTVAWDSSEQWWPKTPPAVVREGR
ncbi:MAG: hypothetical protein ABEH90_01715 [Halolamina sp.]